MALNKETVPLLSAWAKFNLNNAIGSRRARSAVKATNSFNVFGRSRKIESVRFDKFLDLLKFDNDCIVFVGPKTPSGYGVFRDTNGRNIRAHRLSYQIFVEKIKDGLVIDHICRNRACVRPDHLRQVTNKENILAGVGWSATNARKKICVNGHLFTKGNTYTYSPKTRPGDTYRACKLCRLEATRQWRVKNAAV